MNNAELIPNLFRSEYSKLVAVICYKFGFDFVEQAEDIVSDTFLKASETWGIKGIPGNPTGWLYTVAKNNATDYFRRRNIYDSKILPDLKEETNQFEIDISQENILDSQLKMIFAVCDPINQIESQIVLALRILCGFGITEISNSLLISTSNTNKKLYRAKQNLKNMNVVDFELTPDLINGRLDSVLRVLYLLFNEGYYSSNENYDIRKDICYEAMRLLYILINNKSTNIHKTNSLMALFCFHVSRFDARISKEGEFILYEEQDKSKWDLELINKGMQFLMKAGTNDTSDYSYEARIAYWHCQMDVGENQKWNSILQLYNSLLRHKYTPIAALNRTYALSKVKGNSVALAEAKKLNLEDNFYYNCLLIELAETETEKRKHFSKAIKLTKNKASKNILTKKYSRFIN